MYQFVASVDQQGDYNLQLETKFVKKHLVFAQIFECEVRGLLEKTIWLYTLTPIYFEI